LEGGGRRCSLKHGGKKIFLFGRESFFPMRGWD